jgi:hypothetical protein
MSFRALLVIAAVSLTACDVEVEMGPAQERSAVFSHNVAMAAGQTLYLRDMVGSITVEPSADDTLRVVADLKWRGDSTPPTDVTFNASTLADGALVCAVFGGARCSVQDYDGQSNGSGIRIGGGKLRLGLGGSRESEAHFRVSVPAGVKLDLVMVEGDVVSASSAPVRVRGVNGSITVVTSVGPVTAKTMNGSVDARMSSLSGTDSVNVETINGDAYVFLPETASARVHIESTNGTLLTDFPGVADRDKLTKLITATLGSGVTPVRARTINGGVQLRRLDAQGRAYEVGTP